MNIRLQPFDSLGPLLDETVDMYCAAFNEPPYDAKIPEAVADSLCRHSTYPGYRSLIAVDDQRRVLGLVYGYQSDPSQFYHRHLARHLGPALTRTWLKNCFEFVELAVSPLARSQGLGRLLHDRILTGLPFATSILTTPMAPTRALGMYQRHGWQIIGEGFQLAIQLPKYYIMGLKLPYTPTDPPLDSTHAPFVR